MKLPFFLLAFTAACAFSFTSLHPAARKGVLELWGRH